MQKIAILCIGSDKISGDSLGPIVGDLLRYRYNIKCPVYGTTDNPVNGINLPEYRKMIDFCHRDSIIIAIDAAVGKMGEIGQIKIREGGIRAGGAINSPHKLLGNIGIMGVVAEKCENVLGALLDTPFSLVEALADRIATSVVFLVAKLLKKHN